eukprot:TRINITY_DN6851_c1_g1_i2.p1 TRINITY_DN6851_c1_g1~~TRINITY_DN6851_c1_g1_i2.p1  ORF type:complete len:137 (-),score=13.53 TRINITY_DN6851_c1_g1_i2:281-691(-)
MHYLCCCYFLDTTLEKRLFMVFLVPSALGNCPCDVSLVTCLASSCTRLGSDAKLAFLGAALAFFACFACLFTMATLSDSLRFFVPLAGLFLVAAALVPFFLLFLAVGAGRPRFSFAAASRCTRLLSCACFLSFAFV